GGDQLVDRRERAGRRRDPPRGDPRLPLAGRLPRRAGRLPRPFPGRNRPGRRIDRTLGTDVTMLSAATTETLRSVGLDPAAVLDIVERALAEDLGPARLDVTTLATIPAGQQDVGELVARADGVVAGLAVAAAVFETAATDAV